jgi:hypothetical protein
MIGQSVPYILRRNKRGGATLSDARTEPMLADAQCVAGPTGWGGLAHRYTRLIRSRQCPHGGTGSFPANWPPRFGRARGYPVHAQGCEWTFMTDTIQAGQERNDYKDVIPPMPLLEITRMRADIANSRAEWVARSLALRESQRGRSAQPTPPTVRPTAQASAERLETPPDARLFAVTPDQSTTKVDADVAYGQAKAARKWLIPYPWR